MSLLNMSFLGAVMILAVIIIRTMGLQKMPKKTFLILWGIVILRLLIPLEISSPLSIYTAAKYVKPIISKIQSEEKSGSLQEQMAGPVMKEPESFIQAEGETTQILQEAQSTEGGTWNERLWITIAWAAGVCGSLLFFFVPHVKWRREYKKSLPVESALSGIPERNMQLRRKIQVRRSDRIQSPLTYGVFHPVILFPNDFNWEDKERTDYVLIHEWMHIRHFDMLIKYILVITLCIHWFNPFVWMMYILANRDMEMNCDESVLKKMGVDKKASYAMALIEMEVLKSQRGLLYSGFSKNSVEERIHGIMKMKKRSKIVTGLSVTLIASMAIVFTTSASESAALGRSEKAISLRKTEVFDAKQEASNAASDRKGGTTDVSQELASSDVSDSSTSADSAEESSSSLGLTEDKSSGESYTMEAFQNSEEGEKNLEKLRKKSLDELYTEYEKLMKTMEKEKNTLQSLADSKKTFLNLKFQDEFDKCLNKISSCYNDITDVVGEYGIKVEKLELGSTEYQTRNDEFYSMWTAASKKSDEALRLHNKVLESTEAERLKSYKELGVTIEDDNYYLKGERIASFKDGYFKGKSGFSGTVSNNVKGTINVKISRDQEGKVLSLESTGIND